MPANTAMNLPPQLVARADSNHVFGRSRTQCASEQGRFAREAVTEVHRCLTRLHQTAAHIF